MCYGPNKEFLCWELPADTFTEEELAEMEAHVARLLAEADAFDTWPQ